MARDGKKMQKLAIKEENLEEGRGSGTDRKRRDRQRRKNLVRNLTKKSAIIGKR